jgi:DNA-binding phage protein
MRQAVYDHAAVIRISLDELAELDKKIWSNPPRPSSEELEKLLASPLASLASQLHVTDQAFRNLNKPPVASSQEMREASFAAITVSICGIEHLLDNGAATALRGVVKKPSIWATNLRRLLSCVLENAAESVDYRVQAPRGGKGSDLAERMKELNAELLAAMRQIHADSRSPSKIATSVEASTPGAVGSRRNRDAGDLATKALVLLAQHSDWSIAQIAAELGVNRATLYKKKEFLKRAEDLGRFCPRGPQVRESKIKAGFRNRDRQVEAFSDPHE